MGRFSKKADINTDKAAVNTTTEDEMTTDVDVFEDDFDTEDIDTPDAVEVPENAEPEAAPEPDISNFIALIESVIVRDDDDELVGITDEQIKQVREAYQALTRKEKNLAKNELSSRMESAIMEDDDVLLAKVYLDLNNKMVEAGKSAGGARKTATPKKPADPTEAYVKLIAKLDLARALIVIPEDFDADDINRRAGELFEVGAEDVKKDEPELVWVKQAVGLAQPKKTGGGFPAGRKRHSVANHIAEAFANLNPGESLTVDEIVNFKSVEYGDDTLTKQAVVAHLNSKKFQAASQVSVGELDGQTALIKK